MQVIILPGLDYSAVLNAFSVSKRNTVVIEAHFRPMYLVCCDIDSATIFAGDVDVWGRDA